MDPVEATDGPPGPAADDEVHSAPRDWRVLEAAAVVVLLMTLSGLKPWAYTALSDRMKIGVPGARLVELFPSGRSTLVVATIALAVLAVALLVTRGRLHRVVAVAVAILTIWLLGIPQLYGATNHSHAIVWLLVIIAAAPAVASAAEWELWRRVVLVTVAGIYLFPGIAKALQLPDWVTSDYLLRTIEATRAGNGATSGGVPPAWAAHWMAAGAIAFELGYLVLVLTRWRRVAPALAIVFHLSTGLTAGIWFRPLIIINLALLLMPAPIAARMPKPGPSVAVVAILVVMIYAVGLRGSQEGWPVAAFPRFDKGDPTVNAIGTFAQIDGEEHRVMELLAPEVPKGSWQKMELKQPVEVLEAELAPEFGDVRVFRRYLDP